jgi:hypothetical protein
MMALGTEEGQENVSRHIVYKLAEYAPLIITQHAPNNTADVHMCLLHGCLHAITNALQHLPRLVQQRLKVVLCDQPNFMH